MSTETKSKDCAGPLYPQWGGAPGIHSDEVDWSNINGFGGTGTGDDAGNSAADRDGGDIVGIGEDSWRQAGGPEPWGPDAGATTAEYAITTLAACGFAALLVVILKSEPIKELVTGVIQTALGLGV